MRGSSQKQNMVGLLALSLVVQLVATVSVLPAANAIGPLAVPAAPRPGVVTGGRKVNRGKASARKAPPKAHNYKGGVALRGKSGAKKKRPLKKAPPPPPPQALIDNLATRTIAPGIIHKVHRGAMYINVLDVDLKNPALQIKPLLAGETFDRLVDVKDQAQKVGAIAAVNGNYFKRDGTPLGTLIIDGEWISGPIYDRTSLGITDDGRILVDPVTLHGNLETSNPDLPKLWINNINQPRREGTHVLAYTRRWGPSVTMAYDGVLVAVDSTGRVVDKQARSIAIPRGGFVLTDGKSAKLARLNVGDLVNLSWQPGPTDWKRVVHAVSGGPVLIRNGNLYVGLQDEHFRKSWTSNSITARTAIGVTANRHLLLATIEGPHTLWDVAKFLKKLGAVDALNLDGGGSTTMVVNGATVTRNRSTFERRVASTLAIVGRQPNEPIYRGPQADYIPAANMVDFSAQPLVEAAPDLAPGYEVAGATDEFGVNQVRDQYAVNVDTTRTMLEPVAADSPGKMQRCFGWMKRFNPLK